MNGIRHIPLINGIEYGWASVTVNIAGVVEVGITAVSFGDKQNVENIYGAGQYPIARGYGRIEASASITLLKGSVEAIRGATLTGRLQDIAPFDIVVCYVSAGKGANFSLYRKGGAMDSLKVTMGGQTFRSRDALELFDKVQKLNSNIDNLRKEAATSEGDFVFSGGIIPLTTDSTDEGSSSKSGNIGGSGRGMRNIVINLGSLIGVNNNYFEGVSDVGVGEDFMGKLRSALLLVLNDVNYGGG